MPYRIAVDTDSADDGTLSVDETATERYRSTWDIRAAAPPDARRSGQG